MRESTFASSQIACTTDSSVGLLVRDRVSGIRFDGTPVVGSIDKGKFSILFLKLKLRSACRSNSDKHGYYARLGIGQMEQTAKTNTAA